jgi:hypothetical protein
MLINVPLELKPNFLGDPENFIRDIACISTEALSPFFRNRELITKVQETWRRNPFHDEKGFFDDEFVCDPQDTAWRYLHIDLGIRHDACGISMCHASGFVTREKTEYSNDGVKMVPIRMPVAKFDFVGRLKAGPREEILISQVREIIYELSRRGFYIALITFDGFQSTDSIQILKSHGYRVGRLSIDRTSTYLKFAKTNKKKDWDDDGLKRISTEGQVMAAWQCLKDALYDDRLDLVQHDFWEKEAKSAEVNFRKQKVDHPPRGTIDLLQSIAGAMFNMTNNESDILDDDEAIERETGDAFYEDSGRYRDGDGEPDDYLYEEEEVDDSWLATDL